MVVKNLGFSLRHHYRPCHGVSVSFDLILSMLPSWKVSFAPASSFFSVTREGFTLPLLVVIRLFTVAALLSNSPVSYRLFLHLSSSRNSLTI